MSGAVNALLEEKMKNIVEDEDMDVICVGEMLIDFIPGAEPCSYVKNAGGAPANVAIAVARNGLDSGFCGKMGDDDFGRFLADTLRENDVTVLCPELTREAVTTMAFVTLSGNGERTFTFARKPGADMLLTVEDIDRADLDATKMIHAGSCSLSKGSASDATVYALKRGHEKGKIVSFDVNYRNVMWDDDQEAAARKVFEILPYVDLLKISEEEVDMVGGEEHIARLMEQNRIALVVETLGAEGAKCFFGGKVLRIPGRKAKAVDATGAGDAFWGGFLSSLLIQGVDQIDKLDEAKLLKAMEYGNVSGWICVQSKGAISSLPTREQIEAVLNHDAKTK